MGTGAAAAGEESADRLGVEPRQIAEAGRVAVMGCEEAQELAEIARVGVEGVIGVATVVGEVGQPTGDRAVEVVPER